MSLRVPALSLFVFPALFAAEPIEVYSHVAIPMRDGVKLYADVYRPAKEGKYPVLVIRTPYGVQREGVHQGCIRFAQNGYAVVNNDVRGRYESEGKWDPFRNEARDGYDVIEWAARQPWSTGKVATEGGSYLGHVQWAAASQNPPHLVAGMPMVASTSIYHNWAYLGGAFRLSFNFGWGVVRMPFRIMYPQTWHTDKSVPEEWRYENILKHVPLRNGDLESSNTEVTHYRDWIRHQSYDSYWKEISDQERFSNIKVPMHTTGGWFDIFLQGTINGFTGMRKQGGSEKARRESKMIVGAWGHGASRRFGARDFGPTANRELFERQLQWYDHYLKGVDNGIDREPPVEIFFMGVDKWFKAQDWPLPGTRYTEFYLTANRGIATQKPANDGSDQYTYDPRNPVPTLGGNNCCGTPTVAGPQDQRPLEKRPDVLSYSSEALKSALAIAGPVKMKLWAATDGRDTDWMVKLIDVQPDGAAYNIAEGILRARFRNGLDKIELLTPNQPYEFEVDLIGTANVFLPGHRIRVDITSSNFPQFDRNPNTGADLGASAELRAARQTIYFSPQRPSRIVLPVVEAP
jgi:putative CocE/NonD family hydrolase